LNTFDAKKNPVFEKAEATFYLAYKNKTAVGRMAVIVNQEKYMIKENT